MNVACHLASLKESLVNGCKIVSELTNPHEKKKKQWLVVNVWYEFHLSLLIPRITLLSMVHNNIPRDNERYVAIRVVAGTGFSIFGEWFDVSFDNSGVDGGALFKCCQSTNGDAINDLGTLPFGSR